MGINVAGSLKSRAIVSQTVVLGQVPCCMLSCQVLSFAWMASALVSCETLKCFCIGNITFCGFSLSLLLMGQAVVFAPSRMPAC